MAYADPQAGLKSAPAKGARPPSALLRSGCWLLSGIALCLASAVTVAAPPVADPSVGDAGKSQLSPERLQRLDRFLQSATDEQGYTGAVAVVARQGEAVWSHAYGHRDLQRSQPMQEDSIFRIYSMSKTVTSVAVLMLMEEGRLSLDDPLEKYLPEFSGLRVFSAGSAQAPVLQAAQRKLTLHHLLTHTAGFATQGGEAGQLLEQADLHASADLADFAARLAKVPLAVEPGTRFSYDGTQLEVLSRVVEVVSGQRFDQFLQARIFSPLGMRDTGFSVPAAQRGRVVDITRMGESGKLVLDGGPSALQPGVMLNPYYSGAGGLYSTAADFLRFSRMLLNGGSLEGVSVLGRKTVEQMMVNHLTFLDPPVTQFSEAEGFGLGGAVLLDPARRGRLGSVGQFGWSGAASTYFSIDPQERMVVILLLQHLPAEGGRDLPRISTPFYNLVYQALVR